MWNAILASSLPTTATEPELSVSPTSVPAYYAGGTFDLEITSTEPWELEIASSGWVSASVSSGTGDAIVTVSYDANPTPGVGREATITVTSGTQEVEVTITQTAI